MKNIQSLSTILASAVLASVALGAQAQNAEFGIKPLASGYQLAETDTAAKTGEGKCGADKAEHGKGKEGSCGADKKPGAEGKAKEGKCGEGKCGANKKPANAG